MEEELKVFDEHIPVSAKVAAASTQTANMLLSGIGLGAIDIFYLKVLNLDPALMAISWMIFLVWNAFNDPLLGILEDRTKSKLGRRIPYLRFGAPVYALTFIWIWFPFISDQELLFWNHLSMLFVFDTFYSMIGLITYSLPAEMAITAKERGSIMIYTTVIGAIGVVGPIIVPIMFLGSVPNVGAFRIAMIIIGVLSAIVFYISSYYIKENKYTITEESLGFWESIKATFKNKPFLIVEISLFANVIMQNVLFSYFVFLFDYVVDFSFNLLNALIFLGVIAIVFVAVFWLMRNIDKYGLKKLMRMGALIAIIGFLVLLFMGLIIDPTQFNKMPLSTMAIPLICIAFGLICYLLLGQPLMAECIDHDEILTGKRRETTYSGVNALITKPAVSIGHALFLIIIRNWGYNEDISNPLLQPSSVSMGVIIAFTLVPAICVAIGYISLKWYPLDGPEWIQKKRMLQEIHYKKELEYIEYLEQQGIIEQKKNNSTKT